MQAFTAAVLVHRRANDAAITLFVAPQALLMQAPFVGPLVYVPMQFAIAWLLDLLLSQQPASSGQLPGHGQIPHNAFQAAPTRPEPLQQGHYPTVDPQQTGWGPPQQVMSSPEQASAPPWDPHNDSRPSVQYPAVQPSAPPVSGHPHQRQGAQPSKAEGESGLPVV